MNVIRELGSIIRNPYYPEQKSWTSLSFRHAIIHTHINPLLQFPFPSMRIFSFSIFSHHHHLHLRTTTPIFTFSIPSFTHIADLANSLWFPYLRAGALPRARAQDKKVRPGDTVWLDHRATWLWWGSSSFHFETVLKPLVSRCNFVSKCKYSGFFPTWNSGGRVPVYLLVALVLAAMGYKISYPVRALLSPPSRPSPKKSFPFSYTYPSLHTDIMIWTAFVSRVKADLFRHRNWPQFDWLEEQKKAPTRYKFRLCLVRWRLRSFCTKYPCS